MPMALLEMPVSGWTCFNNLVDVDGITFLPLSLSFLLACIGSWFGCSSSLFTFLSCYFRGHWKVWFSIAVCDFFELKYRQLDACSIYTNLNENSRIEYLKRFSADWLALPNTKNNSFPLARPPGCPLLCILLPNLCFDWHVSILGNQLACYKIDAGLCRDFKLNCISIASLQDFSPKHMELNHKQTNQLSPKLTAFCNRVNNSPYFELASVSQKSINRYYFLDWISKVMLKQTKVEFRAYVSH